MKQSASHLAGLKQRHAVLEQHLARELARPLPDADAVQRLKQRKLALKDEITRKSYTLESRA